MINFTAWNLGIWNLFRFAGCNKYASRIKKIVLLKKDIANRNYQPCGHPGE